MWRIRQKNWLSLPQLHKRRDIYFPNAIESTPLVWNNKVYLVLSDRESHGPHGHGWSLFDFYSKEKLFSYPAEYGLGCALAVENRVYVFGTSPWDRQNYIGMGWFDSSFKPQAITPILYAHEDQSFYNTSVTQSPDGYVMAYEVREKNVVNFSIRFVKSDDLIHWTPIGTIFHPDVYAACPTIRYWKGWYYILYLRHIERMYVMCIARTQDFVHFEDFNGNSKYPKTIQVLSPMGTPHEGLNNSDVDLVEYQGMTILMYADGDQRTWGHLRTAVYLGSMGQFFEEYWPAEG